MASSFQEALENSIKAVDKQVEWAVLEDDFLKKLHIAIQNKDLETVKNFEKRAERAERQLNKFGKKLRDELEKVRKGKSSLNKIMAEIEAQLSRYEEQLKERLIRPWFGKKGTIPELLDFDPVDWGALQKEVSSALAEDLEPMLELLRKLKEQLKEQSERYYYDLFEWLKSKPAFVQAYEKEFNSVPIEKIMKGDDADIFKIFLEEWYDKLYYERGKEQKEQRRLFGLRLQKPPVGPIYVRFEYSDTIWPSQGEKDFLPFAAERGRWPQISVLKLEQLEQSIKRYGNRTFTELNDKEKAEYIMEYFGLRPEKRGVSIKDRQVVIFSFLEGEKFAEEPFGYYVNIKLEGEQRPLIMVLKTKGDIRVTKEDFKEARAALKKAA